MRWRAILTADEMRQAEARAIEAGTAVETLMERAGKAAAEAVWRYAGPLPALVLCGPGNNGGDGYVIARTLRDRGVKVRVAAYGEPQSAAAKAAQASWAEIAEPVIGARAAPLLIDALFGTGLKRGLDCALSSELVRLAREAQVSVAVDVPSGVATDDGRILSPVPDYQLSITFQTLKPSHLLQPAARHMGRIAVCDIGVDAESRLHEINRPSFTPPGPDDHKYRRGYVQIFGGAMPGASALAAAAAIKGGAGYVRLIGVPPVGGVPSAVVQSGADVAMLADERVGALLLGPGLGRSDAASRALGDALGAPYSLVLDADALTLLAGEGPAALLEARHMPILTPHGGEFAKLFPDLHAGSKVEQAREAARMSGSVIVFKGADTVVAHPDGRAAISPPASHWLATAGTGDVLAGIVAAMRSKLMDPFDAACAGLWIHGRSAELAGPGLIADDLLTELPRAVAECHERT